MTDEKIKRIAELEAELAPLMEGIDNTEDRRNAVKECASGFYNGKHFLELEREEYDALCEYKDRICELAQLYKEQKYTPDEDEKTLAFMLRDGMSTEEKLKALADAWWYATNSGYCDSMANRLMAGEDSAETQRWERFCKNKWAIDRYYKFLKESAVND